MDLKCQTVVLFRETKPAKERTEVNDAAFPFEKFRFRFAIDLEFF